MYESLYTSQHRGSPRLLPDARSVDWKQHLPASWKDLVIAPIDFDVFREFEIAADRTLGYDADGEPCYCASRYVLSELRSDDDDIFYQEPVYAESLLAWRLRDERWLILRKIIANYGYGDAHAFFSFSDSMPR